MKRWQKTVALMVVGGSTFAVSAGTGCRRAIVADVLTGFGNGAVAAAADAALGNLPDNVQGFVSEPITDAATGAWTNFIRFQFPVIVVRDSLFVQ